MAKLCHIRQGREIFILLLPPSIFRPQASFALPVGRVFGQEVVMIDWNSMMKMLQLCGALLFVAGAATCWFAIRRIQAPKDRGSIRNRTGQLLATHIVRLIGGVVMVLFGLKLFIDAFNNSWPTF